MTRKAFPPYSRKYIYTDPDTGRELKLHKWEAVDRIMRALFGAGFDVEGYGLQRVAKFASFRWRRDVRLREGT